MLIGISEELPPVSLISFRSGGGFPPVFR